MEKKKIHVKNEQFSFDNDYTMEVVCRRKEFNEAKKVLKEKAI